MISEIQECKDKLLIIVILMMEADNDITIGALS
jgi:hypothetical protein